MRPDERYKAAVEMVELGKFDMVLGSHVLICASYVLDQALLIKGETHVYRGPIRETIDMIIKKMILDRVKDPAILDTLALALSKVI